MCMAAMYIPLFFTPPIPIPAAGPMAIYHDL